MIYEVTVFVGENGQTHEIERKNPEELAEAMRALIKFKKWKNARWAFKLKNPGQPIKKRTLAEVIQMERTEQNKELLKNDGLTLEELLKTN